MTTAAIVYLMVLGGLIGFFAGVAAGDALD